MTRLERVSLAVTPARARQFVALVRETNIGFLAAGVAYYAFVSVLPSLLLFFLLVSSIAGEELARLALERVAILTPTGQDLIRDALLSATARLEVSVLSMLVLSWSSMQVARNLLRAFSRIYGVTADPSLVESVRDGGVVLLAIVASVGVQLLFSFPAELLGVALSLVGEFGQFVSLCLTLFPLYYLLPPVRVRVRDALPGTVVAAGGWIGLEFGFGIYAQYFTRVSVYGVFGAFILFVLWLYFAGLLVLLGGCVNAFLAGTGSSPGEPG